MLQRLLLLVLALVAVGYTPLDPAIAAATELGCCPCEDEGAPDDGCCAATCACAAAAAVASTPRPAPADAPRAVAAEAAWPLSAEQRARDRSTAPPTRPPIG